MYQLQFNQKQLKVSLSAPAQTALAKLGKDLLVEMELYFSCFIRKKVRFYENQNAGTQVEDNLFIRFRPVMTDACHISEIGDDGPPLTDFPIKNPDTFSPNWLQIDYLQGEWQGEFGYQRQTAN
ncbi:MAG: hypothetical protein OEZ58_02870 [Gammaproteobacteria bacterium]|nr:hypothetical protein [Gammaproteobacteria bacterium]MDH5727906.1 hypothetical protein [Gammaproteobacteria bacterium]